MPVTQAQIDAEVDPVKLQKLGLTIQLEGAAKYTEAVANGARQAKAMEDQVQVARDMLATQQQAVGGLLSKDQELWMTLYAQSLKTRLGPTVISSTTPDTVMDDIIKDAVRMTQVAYALVKPSVDPLV